MVQCLYVCYCNTKKIAYCSKFFIGATVLNSLEDKKQFPVQFAS